MGLESIILGEGKSGEGERTQVMVSSFMTLVNNHRDSLGLNPLVFDPDLSALATTHSKNMADKTTPFGHSGFSDRCSKARELMGLGNLCGEIVATGQSSAESVFAAWMGSSGHRAKIEEARYTHTGFGYFKNAQGEYYWSEIFLEVD